MKAAAPRATVHLHSLGCPKNRLDTEVMVGALASAGYAIAERLEDADVALINTCSFIESAREESIQAILEVAELRETGRLRGLLVTGCLPQRYGEDLAHELPEVDAFVGTGDFPRIAAILDDALEGRGRGVYVDAGRTHLYDEHAPRVLLGPQHTAYIKIAEGCDRICAFCAIPGIRGRFQSRAPESLLAEAQQLAVSGVREVNLIAQDSTSFGKDLPGRPRLHTLLRTLDTVDGLDWIRLLYIYPSAVTDELIETLATGQRLLPYVDVPLQHASDALLAAMRRGTTQARQRRLVERLRAEIPDVVVRTTFIVGFPGETDADFEELCGFVRDMDFDRAGVFRYSDEEGTAGYDLAAKVPRELARERHGELLRLLSDGMARRLARLEGEGVDVLVDAGGRDRARGRMWSQAPEIDGEVLLDGGARTGELVSARIVGAHKLDLRAERIGPTPGDLRGLPSHAVSAFAPKSAPQ